VRTRVQDRRHTKRIKVNATCQTSGVNKICQRFQRIFVKTLRTEGRPYTNEYLRISVFETDTLKQNTSVGWLQQPVDTEARQYRTSPVGPHVRTSIHPNASCSLLDHLLEETSYTLSSKTTQFGSTKTGKSLHTTSHDRATIV
jgi:hypothetical protein